jgi:hypothetical protein
MTTSAPASIASLASASESTSTSRRRLKPPTLRACLIAVVIDPDDNEYFSFQQETKSPKPDDQIWLSFSMIMLERSYR